MDRQELTPQLLGTKLSYLKTKNQPAGGFHPVPGDSKNQKHVGHVRVHYKRSKLKICG